MTSQDRSATIIIEPWKGLSAQKLVAICDYRELLYFLVWRDLKVRYKQTLLGVMWAVIQPFLIMVVFSLFFGYLAKVPSDGIPYPIFTYVALVPWNLFANGLNQSTNSLVNSVNLITKVYFPRIIIPISAVLSGVLDFFIAFIILIGMMIYYHVVPTAQIIWFPLFLLLELIVCFGVGLWTSALNVEFRDIRYALPFLTQFWFFVTPVAYPSSLLGEPWRTLYGLNPMVGVVEGFRWVVLGTGTFPGSTVTVSALVSVAIFLSGVWYFQRMERSFADII
jgi:lipopolysaccharide transport system permease protein